MNTIEPATDALDCAGIRRMEFGQPLPLRKRASRGAGHGCGLCCDSFRAVALAVEQSPKERGNAASF